MVVYDPVYHHPVEGPDPLEIRARTTRSRPGSKTPPSYDLRFVKVRRPVVLTGGELTLEQLDLQYDTYTKMYQAPFQVKANGGVLILDDFGRQRVPPKDLLNRWIVPLEKRIDFLTLHTGGKFPVPFDTLLIIATNLEPSQLVEEAFLRRIHYKIQIDGPDPEQYAEIFARCCDERGIPYDQAIGALHLPGVLRPPADPPPRLPPARHSRPPGGHRPLLRGQPVAHQRHRGPGLPLLLPGRLRGKSDHRPKPSDAEVAQLRAEAALGHRLDELERDNRRLKRYTTTMLVGRRPGPRPRRRAGLLLRQGRPPRLAAHRLGPAVRPARQQGHHPGRLGRQRRRLGADRAQRREGPAAGAPEPAGRRLRRLSASPTPPTGSSRCWACCRTTPPAWC